MSNRYRVLALNPERFVIQRKILFGWRTIRIFIDIKSAQIYLVKLRKHQYPRVVSETEAPQ